MGNSIKLVQVSGTEMESDGHGESSSSVFSFSFSFTKTWSIWMLSGPGGKTKREKPTHFLLCYTPHHQWSGKLAFLLLGP